jgi:hypothetical protein
LVGQWERTIIVMNGDDYSHRRREPRISVDTSGGREGADLLTIVSDQQGTSLYINGERRAQRTDLSLRMPGDGREARLVFGNSIAGTHGWRGILRGAAVYGVALGEEAVKRHAELWTSEGSFAGFVKDVPLLLYPFADKEGRSASDLSGSEKGLCFPAHRGFVSREVLSLGLGGGASRGSTVRDVLLNLFGFVPFGALLVTLLAPRFSIRRAVVMAATAGCLLSLGIEFAQSWIPTRSSSLIDLLLNTVGAGLGAVLVAGFRARWSEKSARERGARAM